MSNSNSSTNGGIGITGCLFLIFLTLKLAKVGAVATWSWWWVTSPLWLPLAVILPIAALIYIIAMIIDVIGAWVVRRREMRAAMEE